MSVFSSWIRKNSLKITRFKGFGRKVGTEGNSLQKSEYIQHIPHFNAATVLVFFLPQKVQQGYIGEKSAEKGRSDHWWRLLFCFYSPHLSPPHPRFRLHRHPSACEYYGWLQSWGWRSHSCIAARRCDRSLAEKHSRVGMMETRNFKSPNDWMIKHSRYSE